MKSPFICLFTCFFILMAPAQKKSISLDQIWDGSFRTQEMIALHSMNNGQQYSVLNFDRSSRSTSIDLYDYKTLSKVKTIATSQMMDAIPYFTNYTFSDDERQVLLETETEPIFRYSLLGLYYVYNIRSESLEKVSDYKIQEPAFSPDGTKVAYGRNNNIFIKDLISGTTKQITFDGEKNKIINGITDWVYEEEFTIKDGFRWSPDGTQIAYWQSDTKGVGTFYMINNTDSIYSKLIPLPYPKVGTSNSAVKSSTITLATASIAETLLASLKALIGSKLT